MKNDLILICGGGTGGHFFSGVALAEKIVDFYPDTRILFVGTRSGIEARTRLLDSRMETYFIQSKGLKGKKFFSKISALAHMARGFFESVFLLLRLRPKLVVGVGGYASAPTVFAAIVLRFFGASFGAGRVAILDQNSSVGLANKIFSKFPVVASFCGFDFAGFERVHLPIRQKMEKAALHSRSPLWPPRTILIMGGSQGAHGLNEKWKAIARNIHQDFPDIEFLHQTGIKDEPDLRQFYESLKAKAEVFAFSDAMENYLNRADLLICRSGAMSVFEVIAFKRPCIFVPFPAATDDHQFKNAIASQDADWVIRESDFHYSRIEKILKSPAPKVPERKSTAKDRSWRQILGQLLRRA